MASATRRPGFTMIELLGVIVIIGLLMTFVLVAAQGAARDAQRESTRSLIVKLDNALNQLMEAVQSARTEPTNVHLAWAGIYNGIVPMGSLNDKAVMQRASVLARYDLIRAEVPDVFFIQNANPGAHEYPINFAQQPFTGTGTPGDYVLPLGTNSPYTLNNNGNVVSPGTGIYGASYGAAAGLFRNLGNVPPVFVTLPVVPTALLPQGSDGVDNDNDGLIDNYFEGTQSDPNVIPSVIVSLQQHKHNTARAEMLYALLVEGQSQFGAFLNKDDFTSEQIKDTDNDGLPEFVDAWGKPIQFYRWPTLYHSDAQRGLTPVGSAGFAPPYQTVFEQREQDTYDPNQQLTAVAWWSANNSGPNGYLSNQNASSGAGFVATSNSTKFLSGGAFMFQNFFHSLTEPLSYLGANPIQYWDRSSNANFFPRRAFYSRFLILSGGPDGLPGVPVLPEDNLKNMPNAIAASYALQLESQAGQWDLLTRLSAPSIVNDFANNAPNPISQAADDSSGLSFFDMGLDDITNHNLNSTAQVSAQ